MLMRRGIMYGAQRMGWEMVPPVEDALSRSSWRSSEDEIVGEPETPSSGGLSLPHRGSIG